MKKLYLSGIGICIVITLGLVYSSESSNPKNNMKLNQTTGNQKNKDSMISEEQLLRGIKASTSKDIYSRRSSDMAIQPDDNSQPDEISSIDNLINNLSAKDGGLSDTSIETAFRLKNFDSLVYQLQSAATNQEFERQFRNSVHDVAQSNNGVLPRSIGCNDEVCAAVLDYSNQDSPEQFSKELTQKIKQPVSIVTQPVEVQGVKELRVLLNYKNAKIILE